MTNRKTALDIFLTGVESVKPDNLINRFVSINKNTLIVGKLNFDLTKTGKIYVVGAGKASAMMAQAMENILGSRIADGHIVTKYHHAVPLQYIGTTEAGHPVPDENGLKGTEKILSIAEKAAANDIVFCLISGGGSALMADVPDGCTLDDLKKLNDVLLKCGASIIQMNCIRKHLSKVKGGQLAKTAFPATVISLILSDVIGDPLDVIASGPTAPDPTTFDGALAILDAYQITGKIPPKILHILKDGKNGKKNETLKENDEALKRTHNLIIGTNKLALEVAKQKAEKMGYETQIITNTLEGDVESITKHIVEMAKNTQKVKGNEKICLLFAGEPTVAVKGNGLGGRNQHLAILAAGMLKDHPGITILSGGTDGTDGPTDAAGAVSDSATSIHATEMNLSIEKYAADCDSYNFFKQEGGLIITGPTQTNVMDLIVVLID